MYTLPTMFCDKILTYLDTLASHFNYHTRATLVSLHKVIPRPPRNVVNVWNLQGVKHGNIDLLIQHTVPYGWGKDKGGFGIVWKEMGSCCNSTKIMSKFEVCVRSQSTSAQL